MDRIEPLPRPLASTADFRKPHETYISSFSVHPCPWAVHPRILDTNSTRRHVMAPRTRDAALETRTARGRLKARGKPYYRAVEPGTVPASGLRGITLASKPMRSR